MADNIPDTKNRIYTLRTPERIMQDLEILAIHHGTNLTSYINACILTPHLKNPENDRIIAAKRANS